MPEKLDKFDDLLSIEYYLQRTRSISYLFQRSLLVVWLIFETFSERFLSDKFFSCQIGSLVPRATELLAYRQWRQQFVFPIKQGTNHFNYSA